MDNEGENKIGGMITHANEEDENARLDINGEHAGPTNLEEDKGEYDPHQMMQGRTKTSTSWYTSLCQQVEDSNE